MNTNLFVLASRIQELTYSEMMEVADRLTSIVREKQINEEEFDPECKNDWAEMLTDWATNWLEENKEDD